MKVLLIGNDKFVAQALIKRCLIENNVIFLAGKFNDPLDKTLAAKTKYYDIDISTKKLEDVFIINSPDIVVYFNNCQRSMEKDMTYLESNAHIKALMNSYHYTVRAKAKSFIYLSSAEARHTSDGIEDYWLNTHRTCEDILDDIKIPQRTNHVILRLTKIFGMGQSPENCNICRAMYNRVYSTKYKTEEMQSDDYIHISDVANAVVKSCGYKQNAKFIIASGYYLSYEMIESILKGNEIKITKQTSYSIKKAREKLGFKPQVDVADELKKMLSAEMEKKEGKTESVKQRFKRIGKKLVDKGQMVIDVTSIFVVIALFYVVFHLTVTLNQPMLYNRLDLRILFVMAIGLFYGLRHEVVAILLGISLYFYEYSIIEDSYILTLYNQNFYLDIIILTVVGLGIAFIRENHRSKIADYRSAEAELEDQLTHLKNMYYDSLKVKNSLADQVYNTSNNYGKLFSIISSLDSLEFSKLKMAVINAAEEVLENKALSLYILDDNNSFLRLVAKSKDLEFCENSIDVAKNEYIAQVIKTHDIFINRDVENKQSMRMIAPVIDQNNEVVAIFIVNHAGLEQLTQSYINLFKVTSRLISQAIVRAYLYEKAHLDKWFYENSEVLLTEYFDERVKTQKEIYEGTGIQFALLEVANETTEELIKNVPDLVQDSDYVGLSEDGKLRILLNNVTKEDVAYIQQKLKKSDIETIVIK